MKYEDNICDRYQTNMFSVKWMKTFIRFTVDAVEGHSLLLEQWLGQLPNTYRQEVTKLAYDLFHEKFQWRHQTPELLDDFILALREAIVANVTPWRERPPEGEK